ncbi:hypothetical protein OCO53_25520 [Peribacillus frigoritolerans]|uniref:hypothetical protein n=1 Tax=Peribacillus frigoritolerans TaxID=450367 RepID=UPI0021D25955|nr:hypothetical protein [Peribacillus frigoritolerans]MCU6603803.1 hypothetical protein [Peribacillus frigoritolerans]
MKDGKRRVLLKAATILFGAYFLIPASADWMTWDPLIIIYDEHGNIVDSNDHLRTNKQ